MKVAVTMAAVMLLTLTVAWGQCGGCCGAKASGPSCHPPTSAGRLADMTLVSLDGDTYRIADESGPVAVVCLDVNSEPINDSFALVVQQAHEDAPDKAIWGIACGEPEDASAFVARLGLNYPVLLDPGCGMMKSLGIEKCPAAVVVNPDGHVVQMEEEATEETMNEGMRAASEQNEFVDPVCRMTVTKESAVAIYEHEGRTYYFCSVGCRERFAKDPARFLAGGQE